MRTNSATILRDALSDSIRRGTLKRFLESLSAGELRRLHYDWPLWAREDQLAPEAAQGGGDWTTWLMLGGRGAGKTRAGAEWVRSIAEAPRGAFQPPPRIALIGETFADARSVMVEGVSGLLAVHPPETRPLFEASKQRVTWPNGAVAQLFSAEDPESLRGPQFDAAWADELAKWRRPEATWDMLQFGLRLGERPRQVVTTTPRPLPLIKALLAEPSVAVTRVATAANAVNLAPRFLEAIVGKYRGTRLGRQELMAELLEDRPDALWPRALIEGLRVGEAPALRRIVVAGVSGDGLGYVLKDRTVQGLSPAGWAKAALAAYHAVEADCIVAEVNQGGELVEAVLRQVDRTVPVRSVRATRGKFLRAEPVAALYEQGRVFHVGSLAELEDEMSDFGPDGLSGGRSPDRVDALVWALTALMLQGGGEPRVRGL
ncbi:DNA-packaging protein [Methyloligella solikamskensis]|uniref:DNA-packaging protein n=1 Tax=Methyloligella solikamskensis TaxID=1177756 RepID=A0ABW3J8J3_9HYPH